MSTVDLPKINQPFIDPRSGQISRPWWIWLQQLMARVGGSNGTDLTALEAAVTALLALTAAQGNQIDGFVPLPPDTDEHADDGMVYVPPQDLSVTAPVQSVFGRTGAVTAQSGDYTVGQVTNAASILLTLAQFAPTTSAALAGVMTDETGSGALVFGTSPTISSPTISGGSINNTPVGATTPNTGAFTALSTTGTATLNALSTGNAAITGGAIEGTSVGGTTASSGRFTSLTVTTGGAGITGGLTMASGAITPVSTTGIAGTTTNDSAAAGAFGEYQTANTAGVALTNGVPANATSISLTAGDWDVEGVVQFSPAGTTQFTQLIIGISATSATFGALGTFTTLQHAFTTGASNTIPTPVVRLSLAATTTVYVVAQAGFTVSTMSASGFIRARRVR